jgi:hypothetical protein
VTHTYETDFDWIRVYQKKGQENTNGITGIESADAQKALEMDTAKGCLKVNADAATTVTVYTPAGYCVHHGKGTCSLSLPGGVYIVNGEKILVP